MPTLRRWRIFAIVIIFTVISLFYLTNQRNTWNYGYTPYVPNVPVESDTPDQRIRWKPLPEQYPVSSHIKLPTGKPKQIPAVQAPRLAEDAQQKKVRLERRDAVKECFSHSWEGYKGFAWLADEVAPLSGKSKNIFGGWAATLVDSLDTLWIMGYKEDFERAVKAAETIDFTRTDQQLINVFETTIRYMGGFLAAYDISGGKYPGLLKKATEVGDLLMSCFDTPNRMPISRWDWKEYARGKTQKAPNGMLVSELGSLSLEFTRLSQLTGNPKYYDAVQRISNAFEVSQKTTKLPGMWPVSINAEKLNFSEDTFFTLGGMSDSLYEYFPKQYLILGGLHSQPKTLYENFVEVAKKYMFFRVYNPENLALTVSGDVRVKVTEGNSEFKLNPRGQHLTCFTGGMLALASKIFSRPDDLVIAEELTSGCVWAYDSSPNGIAPEIFSAMPCPLNDCKWNEKVWQDYVAALQPTTIDSDLETNVTLRGQTAIKENRLPPGFTTIDDRRYILRPEAIESVFIMYRTTGEQKWQDAAWRMFQAIEKITRTTIAAAAIADITMPAAQVDKMDSMESFWLAETLKYFYLCFEEWDVISLDEWVLNTEAHPLKRPK